MSRTADASRGRRRRGLAAAALLLIGAASAPAHADPVPGPDDTVNATDESFLGALQAAGIRYGQPEQAVKSGRTLCDLADNGKTDEEILAILVKHNDLLSDAHANTFMDIAYAKYCPQYLPSNG